MLPYNPVILVQLKVKNLGILIPDRMAGVCKQESLFADYLDVRQQSY
jgi:hypothetical protein